MERIVKVIRLAKEGSKQAKGRINQYEDGIFEAFTLTQAKKYKTLRGAKNFMTKAGYTVEVETKEVEQFKPMTTEEKTAKAVEIVNADAFKVDRKQAVTLYVQGTKLYGVEFENGVKHSVYSLVRNTLTKFAGIIGLEFDEAMEILLTSTLNGKSLKELKKELKEVCKQNIDKDYDFDNMEKWQLILLLHCWNLEGDEALTIQDDVIDTDDNSEAGKTVSEVIRTASEEVKPVKAISEQVNKIQRLIKAINEVNPLLDELNEAMEDIMYDNDCNELGVSQLIKDFYTSITCSGFLEDFKSVASYDLKQLKQ